MPGAALLTRTPLLAGGGVMGAFASGSTVEGDLVSSGGTDLHPINYAVAAMPSGSQGHVVLAGWSTVRLAAQITAGATSLTVTSTDGVPAAPFEVVIGSEVITVGATAGTAWSSLTRHERGTTAGRHLAGAKIASRPHTVVMTSGSDTWDYTARWGRKRGMKRTTLSPGGYGELSFSVMDRAPITAAPTLGAEVEVSDAAGVYWHGIVSDVEIAWRPNGSAEVSITCRGYAITATDDVYLVSTTHPAYTPIYQIMRDARTALCPQISTDNSRLWGGARSILVATPDLIGKTAQEIWREMASQGDPNGEPICWHVWRNGLGEPILETMPKPLTLRLYQLNLANTLGVRARYSRERVRNQIAVGFSSGYATATGSTTPLSGTRRTLWTQAQNQLDSYGVARQVAQTMLDAYGSVVPLADSIVVPYRPTQPGITDGLTGYPVPLWRVDAGSHLEITGPATGNDDLPVPATFFIKQTEFDYDRLTLTIQTEERLTLENITGQYLKTATAAPDSPIHVPPPSPPINPPEHALSPNLVSNIPSASTDRRLNTRKLAQGLDKITLLAVDGNGLSEIEPLGWGYLAHNTPWRAISATVKRDNVEHSAGTVSVTFEKVSAGGNAAPVGTTVGVVTISNGWEGEVTFEQVVNDDPNLNVHFQPEDRLRWQIAESPAPDATTQVTINVYGMRLAGEKDLPTKADPSIKAITVTGSGPGVVIVRIETAEVCEVQVEYGESTDYGSFSAPTQMYTSHNIAISGLAQGVTYFYRVRLVDSHGNGTTSAAVGTFTA